MTKVQNIARDNHLNVLECEFYAETSLHVVNTLVTSASQPSAT